MKYNEGSQLDPSQMGGGGAGDPNKCHTFAKDVLP